MTSVAGQASGRSGMPKPREVSRRSRCFIDTVSPARSKVRSITVWARWSGAGSWLVGTLKRQGSMPRCQWLQVKARSSTRAALPGAGMLARALTKYAGGWSSPPMQAGGCGDRPLSSATPWALVVPRASGLPLQSDTCTAAPATGWPLSSVVTQASAFSRPSLKCTPRLVTRAEVRTTIVRGVPWRSSSSAAPSIGEAISTTWKPADKGMPTTSKGRRSLFAGLGRSSVFTPAWPGQQRDHARLHLVAFIGVQRARQRALDVGRGLAARHGEVVVALHLAEPRNDVGVGLGLQVADLAAGRQAADLQRGLDVAQGHRQQRRGVAFGVRLGEAFHDAKRRGRELGQRRHHAGRHLEWKTRCIGGGAPAGVLEAGRQFDREGGLLREHPFEAHPADQCVALGIVAVERRLEALTGRLQANRLGQLSRHRGVEGQAHRADRQAGGLGVLALAIETHRKRLAHREGKALFHRIGHAAGRRHTFSKDDLHLRGGREAPGACECNVAQRVFGRRLLQPLRRQQRGARRAVDEAHRHALAQAVQRAPDVGLQAGRRGRAVELHQEMLLLLDALVGARTDVCTKGPPVLNV
jgi:hypothetical protein